jgi:hypothetical protein
LTLAALAAAVAAVAPTPEARERGIPIEDETAHQEALDRFVARFRRKWEARTVCRAPWASELDCGRVVG